MTKRIAHQPRCDMVVANPDQAFRCVYPIRHRWARRYTQIPCEFKGSGDQEICGRRSTHHGIIGRTRYCSMTREHEGLCIYLPITERIATADEMRMETADATG